jgi:hypothetical protein
LILLVFLLSDVCFISCFPLILPAFEPIMYFCYFILPSVIYFPPSMALCVLIFPRWLSWAFVTSRGCKTLPVPGCLLPEF